jgi:hypothetical protein
LDAANDQLDETTGFGLFLLKAMLNGRGDELIDLANQGQSLSLTIRELSF